MAATVSCRLVVVLVLTGPTSAASLIKFVVCCCGREIVSDNPADLSRRQLLELDAFASSGYPKCLNGYCEGACLFVLSSMSPRSRALVLMLNNLSPSVRKLQALYLCLRKRTGRYQIASYVSLPHAFDQISRALLGVGPASIMHAPLSHQSD